MDEKTKEIVTELRAISPETYGMTDRAASLIESLSERVGELEGNLKEARDWFNSNRPQWGPGTLPTWFVDAERALLSKQEERG